MTPKEEQKCQHVWCDIKGNECGACHLCGEDEPVSQEKPAYSTTEEREIARKEKPPIQPWEERFDKEWPGDTYLLAKRFYEPNGSVETSDNQIPFIKQFIRTTLQEQKEELTVEAQKRHARGFEEGYDLCKEELLRVIEGMKGEGAKRLNTFKEGYKGGWNAALEELKRTIAGV